MAKGIPISEQFQHFVRELQESFWGDLYGKTRVAWKQFLEAESQRERNRWVGRREYERGEGPRLRSPDDGRLDGPRGRTEIGRASCRERV